MPLRKSRNELMEFDIPLFVSEGETSTVVRALIDDDGSLVIAGLDVGEPTDHGDFDYLYCLEVSREYMHRVFQTLRARKYRRKPNPYQPRHIELSLLAAVRGNYRGHPDAFNEFRSFLEAEGIPYEIVSIYRRRLQTPLAG